MESDLNSIITNLERQRDAIDSALSALRQLGGPAPRGPGRPRKEAGVPAPKKRVLSPEGRQRIIDATKKRWAAKKAAGKAASKSATKKSGLTAAGRKRLSDMMKARWASKNPPK